jgi:hypothetical protein
MVALAKALPAAAPALHELVKRKKNWAQRQPGVILVFCIVAAVVLLLTGLWLQKKVAARRAAKAALWTGDGHGHAAADSEVRQA